MLGYVLRTLPLVARARIQADGATISRVRRRVWLGELNPGLHMDNAVYSRVVELGRLDLLVRSRVWERWRARRVQPMIAEQRILYRRVLRPLAAYTVDTRAVATEGRLLRLESHLLVADAVHALAETKLIFIGQDGVVAPERVDALCADLLVEPLAVEDWKVVRRAA